MNEASGGGEGALPTTRRSPSQPPGPGISTSGEVNVPVIWLFEQRLSSAEWNRDELNDPSSTSRQCWAIAHCRDFRFGINRSSKMNLCTSALYVEDNIKPMAGTTYYSVCVFGLFERIRE